MAKNRPPVVWTWDWDHPDIQWQQSWRNWILLETDSRISNVQAKRDTYVNIDVQ